MLNRETKPLRPKKLDDLTDAVCFPDLPAEEWETGSLILFVSVCSAVSASLKAGVAEIDDATDAAMSSALCEALDELDLRLSKHPRFFIPIPCGGGGSVSEGCAGGTGGTGGNGTIGPENVIFTPFASAPPDDKPA